MHGIFQKKTVLRHGKRKVNRVMHIVFIFCPIARHFVKFKFRMDETLTWARHSTISSRTNVSVIHARNALTSVKVEREKMQGQVC